MYLSAAKVVHSDKKQRTKRQHSNVLNDDMWEMPIQCEGIDCTDHVLTTCANVSFNNEA